MWKRQRVRADLLVQLTHVLCHFLRDTLQKWLSRKVAHHCDMAQFVRLLQRRGQRPSAEVSVLHSDTIFEHATTLTGMILVTG